MSTQNEALSSPNEEQKAEVLGPYRLEEQIGAGGMGVVYRAYDTRLGRRVAVKHLPAPRAQDEAARRRFRREARLAAGLNHPVIVHLYDLIHGDDGDEWIVMELVEGRTVAEMIRLGALEIPLILKIAQQTAEALAEAHARGVIHRDLKTENVMVASAGRIKVLDFGLAKQLSASAEESLTVENASSLTDQGTVLGTYRAMSPEQARGFEVDERTDLFSLGVLIYEAATGRRPFSADSPVASLTRICTFDPPPLIEVAPDLPVALSTLVESLMHKTPAGRPPSAEATAEALYAISQAVPKAPAERSDSHLLTARKNPAEGRPEDAETLVKDAGAIDSSTTAASLEPPLDESFPKTAAPPSRSKQRPLAFVAGILGLMLLGLLIIREQRSRERADQTREQSADLVSFLLDDLRTELLAGGRFGELDAVGRAVLEYFEGLDSEDFDSRTIAQHAKALHLLGDVHMAQGEHDQALELFQRSVDRTRSRVEQDPEDRDALFELGQGRFWVGNVYFEKGDLRESLVEMRAYLEISKQLHLERPEDDDLLKEVADGHTNVGTLLVELGNTPLAREHYSNALELNQQLAERNPSDRYLLRQLITAHLRMGQMLENDGELESAYAAYAQAVEVAESAHQTNLEDTELSVALAVVLDHRAGTALFLGDLETSRRVRLRQLQILEEMHRSDPKQIQWGDLLASARYKTAILATWSDGEERAAAPLSLLRTAIDWHESLIEQGLGRRQDTQRIAQIQNAIAEFHLRAGEFKEAREASRRSLAAEDRLWHDDFDAKWILGKTFQETGAPEEARVHFLQALEAVGDQSDSRYHVALSRRARAQLALGDLDAAKSPVYKLLGMNYAHPRFRAAYAEAEALLPRLSGKFENGT